MKSIPVMLITGFLGSGKTTLLNYLVRQPELSDSLIIINEFGAIGLDHLLVAHSTEDVVVELSSGCVCCKVRSDLVKTLVDVDWRFTRRGKRQFKRVIIETTGLADPAPILHTLITHPELAMRYHIDATLVTVDAATAHTSFDKHREAIKQAALADCLLLTKVDLVSPTELAALHARLDSINPAAPRILVHHGVLQAADILDHGLRDTRGKLTDMRRWLNEDAYVRVTNRPQHSLMGRAPPPDSSVHDDEIRAFCFYVDKPIAPELFEPWLNALMSLFGESMLRIKGILNVKGHAKPMVIHGVHHIIHPPFHLPAWPTDERRSQIVCITRNISQAVVEGSFKRLVALIDDSQWNNV